MTEPLPQQQTVTIQQAIDLGVEHHNAGRLPEAESVYNQILKADPNQPVPMHLLGVLAHQVGKNEVAHELISKALVLNPAYAEAHNNLGVVFKELGRLDEAEASYNKALAIKPDYPDARNNLSSLQSAIDGAGQGVGGVAMSFREAAVAGQFYPGDAKELEATVRELLDQACSAIPQRAADDIEPERPPKAIIAPHAGYIYSGAIAARAYALLTPAAATIKRVVLMGPNHRVPLSGMALSSANAFRTPLGEVVVDRDAVAEIADLSGVLTHDEAHREEHSLEVHLPFLQVLLDDFKIVPLVVGQATPAQVADVMETLWGGSETLIVVSSDLSHYLNYDEARQLDNTTCKAIENLDPAAISTNDACGRFPVGGILEMAKRRDMAVTTLDVRNSGDTVGSKDRVVGYGSWMFQETRSTETAPISEAAETTPKDGVSGENSFGDATQALLDRQGKLILMRAAQSIEYGLANGEVLPTVVDAYPDELAAPGACFVSLKRNGQLRGCIGSFVAQRPLITDVTEHAFNAAFKDGRFTPLVASELEGLALSISVLSALDPMVFSSEAAFMSELRPGTDGLLIKDGAQQAIFLPFVWSQMPDTRTFVENLKVKAGLSRDHWSGTFQAWRFVARDIYAADLDNPDSIWGAGAK